MTKGNGLVLDLEKKLNLYSNYEKELSTIENTECQELVDIIFLVHEEKIFLNEIKKFNNKYDENIVVDNNKIKYSNPKNFSKIGIKIFQRLYFKEKEIALVKWLEMIQMFDYSLWYWLEELSTIDEIKEYFLDKITNYLIKNKQSKEKWIKKFEEYESNKPSYHRYFDISLIPISFENYFDIYKFFKENKYQDFLFDRFGTDIKTSFICCLIEHEVSRSYYYNENSYLRINKLLNELKDDYFVIGEILSSENLRFNTYLLSNSKYCHYGFLNILTMHIPLNNLINEYEFDYNKQWLELISNQTVDIFISTLLCNDKNHITQIVFYVINFLIHKYFKTKQEFVTLSLEKFLNKLSSLVLKDNTSLFNSIVDNLVEKQIKLLEQNESIQEDSYFILNWYLRNLDRREKIDDINYSNLKEKITKAIFENIKKMFLKSIETKHFHVNTTQIMNNIDFNLFYEFSSGDLKNNWINLLDIKQLKADMKTDDRYYSLSLGKFYLEVLISFYQKTYDEKLEKTIVELVLKLGVEEELGIFFSSHENGLYESFLIILNNFHDENYQLFINKIFEINDIKNLLQIYHLAVSNERKEDLKAKISSFDFKSVEFNNYRDLQNSINFSLNHNFSDVVNSLIEKYKEALEEDKQVQLKRENLKKLQPKIDEKKDDNTIRININSYEILNSKIQAFEQLKYKKDLVDIFYDKAKTLNEKLKEIESLQLPAINTKSFRDNELKIGLTSYRNFIKAMIYLDENPLTTYDILKRLNQNKPNHQYLINMLRAYYEAYKNDKNKKEKFEHLISEYKKYEQKLENHKKELYDYQILLALYEDIDDFRLFSELWSELPRVYHFDLYIAQIRCKFLQKNKQLTEALSHLDELKKHHKSFDEDETKELDKLEEKIKKQITIEVKENIATNVVLEKSNSFDESKAREYWLKIKEMDDESHAHIFLRKNNIEEYIKTHINSVLKEVLIRSNNLIQPNGKLVDEDIITDWIISLLREKQKYLSWSINSDRASHSATGIKAGELDLIIRNGRGDAICIGEALKYKIEEHMNKLSGYNASGLKLIVVFVYTKENDFVKYSTSYRDKISNMNYKGFDNIKLPVNVEKIDSQSSTIHLYKEIRQKNKEKTTILHYLLDFN